EFAFAGIVHAGDEVEVVGAAAHPSGADYLYFVSRMDNTGKSEFSRTLDEHNANVRRYILKRP
uniref:endolytic transglycosylase MltG n=1 Tax=Eikenella corrodens TaxID=539 RepID=UPI0018785195